MEFSNVINRIRALFINNCITYIGTYQLLVPEKVKFNTSFGILEELMTFLLHNCSHDVH